MLILGNIWEAHDSSPWQNNFINGIQIHSQSPWFKPIAILSMKFKSIIKSHDLNPWQFYLSKTQFTLAISSKAQFSRVISKSQILIGNIKSLVLASNIKSLVPAGNIKSPILNGNIKVQLTLALLKAQTNYLALFYQKPKVINTWQNTIP